MRSVSLICGVVISSAVGAIDLPNIDHYPATPETIQQCVKDYNTKKELKSTFFDFLTNESDLKKVNQWCKEMRELFSACRYGKGGPSAGYICRWLKAGARDILNYAVSKTIKPTFILSSAHNACLENLNERCSVFEELLKHETISEKLSTALQRRVTLNKSTALAQKFNKCRQSALNAKRTSKDQALKKVANALMSTCSALFKLIHANNITKI
ncbi:MAG TPA: hypothetical protein VNJ29_00845, partial [Candidatus Nitrosotenuis sp.]|nr:hypothetical protein [Candidatus Nitrosotenuis sp.]